MRSSRAVVVSFIFVFLLGILAAPSVSAASVVADPPMPSSPLLDLSPGGSVNFVGTVTTPDGEPSQKMQVGLDFNGVFVFSGDYTPAPGTTVPITIAVDTDILIANCVGGSITYEYWGSAGGPLEVPPITVPCSIKPVAPPATAVTPVLPTVQTEVCGPNNDVITVPAQPTGIVTADSGWNANTRTVSFTAAPGYEIVGNASATFTDNATLCPTEVVTPMVEPTAMPAVVPPAANAPAAVVTSLPSTGSGDAAGGSMVTFALVAVVALIGATGVRRAMRG